MIAATLLFSLTACTSGSTEAPAPVAPPARATHWEMVGSVTKKKSAYPVPAPFEGGRKLTEKCKERRPCAAERWRSESGETMDMLLIERTYHFGDDRTPWPAQWVGITGTLRACIGDPLSIPPADDPESVRTLMMSEDTKEWWLHFSGKNICGLEGIIRLDANGDGVDISALRCEGKRWKEGGRECARAKLMQPRPK